MSIFVDEKNKVLVQGATGHQGVFHIGEMLNFGTKVVAGVTPGKGGQDVHGVPVFDSVREAVDETGADTSLVLVPARFAKDAVFEALDAGVKTVVVITENIPFHDAMEFVHYAKYKGALLIGPNCPGIASPGKTKIGILPGNIFKVGNVGVASRSGTLTYEIVNSLSEKGIGQSTCVGLGGDPIIGTTFIEALDAFEKDKDTKAVVLVGEIGGTAEEDAAEYIKEYISKPVFAFIAGRTAPPGKRMGHAGAIIARGKGTAESKIKAFEKADVKLARFPTDIADLIEKYV
ncbi:MAG: succinate--CoA ligase subunit alpha [Thermoplasmata archaeon]|nr:MAG: succinate--CoA ligase subunit alpha [Thermoplasmata archaeon]RLF32657.1 MAG: succinate--CoA ligase subunit alpha [Thermoplasmata archaeon]RLF37545.1 MAG: succinate--CoA ligase subunit alpha [Thermoplasmata archaeon]RLF53273.1 MAG: succinate--CoA ligase subunit alpha [Thermoplasmata archaeon]